MSSRKPHSTIRAILLVLFAYSNLPAQNTEFVAVVSKRAERLVNLPGELYPYLSVQLRARVAGFVEKVLADRGAFVKKGELLVQLSAPEMMAHISEAEARLSSAQSDQAQADAQLAAARSTQSRLEDAAKTPGAVAENDLLQAKAQRDAADSLVHSRQRAVASLEGNLNSLRDLAAYLRVTAPFDGVISTRYVHPGALAGPGSDVPLLQLDQITRLRLVVAVPEAEVSAMPKGTHVTFRVPAYPDRTFSGVVARPAYTLDTKTRTMPVEIDVANAHRLLAPGMYPTVLWPAERAGSSLFVPSTSVVTTTERVFVIRNDNGIAHWTDVRKGAVAGNLVEVYGQLKAGEEIVRRATDEIRDGSQLR